MGDGQRCNFKNSSQLNTIPKNEQVETFYHL